LGDEKRWFLPGARPGGQRGAHGPDVLSERLNALARHCIRGRRATVTRRVGVSFGLACIEGPESDAMSHRCI
jgi:hypothetical protein